MSISKGSAILPVVTEGRVLFSWKRPFGEETLGAQNDIDNMNNNINNKDNNRNNNKHTPAQTDIRLIVE